jgi:hypothetical protein
MTETISEFYKATSWLYIKIYENSLFFFDYWSIVHVIAAILIMLVLYFFDLKYKLTILMAILLGWELFEIGFLLFALNIFKPETFSDQVVDIIIGFLAGYFTKIIIENKAVIPFIKKISKEFIGSLLISGIISFFWVGFYKYHYNVEELNAPGFNFWAFSLWFLGILGIIRYFLFIRKVIKIHLLSVVATWISYFVVLLIVEYIGRYLIQIQEVSNPTNTPLIFGLIYGNKILHIIYVIMPFIVIFLFLLIQKITTKLENSQKLIFYDKISNKEKVLLNNSKIKNKIYNT